MPATFELVSSVNVGTNAPTSISFTSIPQTATDFVVIGTLKTTNTLEVQNVTVQLNSSNADRGYSMGSDRSGGSNIQTTFTMPIRGSSGGDYPTLSFSGHRFYVSNYSSTSRTKTMLTQSGQGEPNLNNPPITQIGTGRWNTTSAITSFSVTVPSNAFAQFSSLSLYLITKA